jgi:hypothetical protein
MTLPTPIIFFQGYDLKPGFCTKITFVRSYNKFILHHCKMSCYAAAIEYKLQLLKRLPLCQILTYSIEA